MSYRGKMAKNAKNRKKVLEISNYLRYLCGVENSYSTRKLEDYEVNISALERQEKIRVAAGFLLSCFL